MNLETVTNYVATNGVDLIIKIAAAIAMWVIGRYIIKLVMGWVGKALARGGKVDETLANYITSILSVLLTIGLAVGILGYFGIQTTTFAALLAGAGLAIGTAWGGLLTHFAAGAFLQVLRPFKVGDYVLAGGTEGTVKQLGLFGTTITSPDNVTTIVGNNKIFSETIKNFSDLPVRRVDTVAKVANSVNATEAMRKLSAAIATIPNVATEPKPEIEILEFTAEGPKLAVRPYCNTAHYWQVYFDTHRKVVEVFGAAGYPVPETPQVHRQA